MEDVVPPKDKWRGQKKGMQSMYVLFLCVYIFSILL